MSLYDVNSLNLVFLREFVFNLKEIVNETEKDIIDFKTSDKNKQSKYYESDGVYMGMSPWEEGYEKLKKLINETHEIITKEE